MGVDIVCLSFSLELYVKDLHYAITGEAPKGHNILKLFRGLPERTRDEVFSHPSVAHYGWSLQEFKDQIDVISDGFEKWRYSHESTTLRYNAYFALVFIEAVRSAAASERSRSTMGNREHPKRPI